MIDQSAPFFWFLLGGVVMITLIAIVVAVGVLYDTVVRFRDVKHRRQASETPLRAFRTHSYSHSEEILNSEVLLNECSTVWEPDSVAPDRFFETQEACDTGFNEFFIDVW